MEFGGIEQQQSPRVFLTLTTHGGEAQTLAAGRAVLKEYQKHDVIGHQRRTVKDVNDISRAFHESLVTCALGIRSGVEKALIGQPTQPVFRRFNGWLGLCPTLPCPHQGDMSRAVREKH